MEERFDEAAVEKILSNCEGESKNHLLRVRTLTKELLLCHYQRLNLSYDSNMVNVIAIASILHDIGKMSVPKEILFKKGRLNPRERAVIETHTVAGFYLLKKIAGLENVTLTDAEWAVLENIVLHHHEKWDGTGYPHGLKENNIPFEARVVSIVDVFDALLQKRCYKPSWSLEETLHYIEAQKGVSFDPDLVASFFHMQNQVVA